MILQYSTYILQLIDFVEDINPVKRVQYLEKRIHALRARIDKNGHKWSPRKKARLLNRMNRLLTRLDRLEDRLIEASGKSADARELLLDVRELLQEHN